MDDFCEHGIQDGLVCDKCIKGMTIDYSPLEYTCEKHGNVGDLGMEFNFAENQDLNINFCLMCYREKLIEIGVCELTQVEDK